MARTVSGTFADREHVDSVLGALREASFQPGQLVVIGPDGRSAAMTSEVHEGHGVGSWLKGHLPHRGSPPAQPEQDGGLVPGGHWLVTVTIETDAEERDARTLLVSAGAQAISNVADGNLVAVR